jgi:hypothetical protein
MGRRDGLYNVKINGKWVLAKWVTNQDIDSSWNCWWIEGVEPKAWGWSDEDFEEINETPIQIEVIKRIAIEFSLFRDTYKSRERQKMNIFHRKIGGFTSWVGTSDENIFEAFLENNQHEDPLEEAQNF